MLLVFDEAQLLPQSNKALEGLLDRLHNQNDLPILPLFGGLGNSRAVLRELGLSRMHKIYDIGGFAPGEAVDAARGAIAELRGLGLGAEDATADQWANAFAVHSDNWPQHVSGCIKAMAQSLLEHGKSDLNQAHLADALQRAKEVRMRYYAHRHDSIAPVPDYIAREVHARLQADPNQMLQEDQVLDVIDRGRMALGELARRDLERSLPTSRDIFERLLRAGVVSIDIEKGVTSPILSLTGYLLERTQPRTSEAVP